MNKTMLSPSPILPIGLFDSGVGGLTVLKALQKIMPGEDYIYLGDTARLPYGTKSSKTICQYALQASTLLIHRNIKFLIIACNTATAAALPTLQKTFPNIPIIGVIEPSAQKACNVSTTGNIAVIATSSTIQSGIYKDTILQYQPKTKVTSLACPLFVPLVEEGWTTGPIVEDIVKTYLEPLFHKNSQKNQPDCIILGCTHYPLLVNVIRTVIGPQPIIVNSSETTATRVQEWLVQNNMLHPEASTRKNSLSFLTTDDIQKFMHVGKTFLNSPMDNSKIELVDLQSI